MKIQSVYVMLLAVIVLFSATDGQGASRSKTMELNRKISEMSALQFRISERIAVALKARDQLQNQIDELAKEINRIRKQREIKSYRDAAKHPRIGYNIELIRQLSAYIGQLNERITYFRSGNETLIYLHQQVSDDLKLIRTLNDMEVDGLIHKINSVLDEYIPEIRAYIITVKNVRREAQEKIWNRIINANLN